IARYSKVSSTSFNRSEAELGEANLIHRAIFAMGDPFGENRKSYKYVWEWGQGTGGQGAGGKGQGARCPS
ncbi:MAG: hypothetical protein DRJ15_09705, partial [Bacteroidetes bacterium]